MSDRDHLPAEPVLTKFHDWPCFKTSYDVWKAIKAAHPNLSVYSSYSAPEGGRMETTYGFQDASYPIMGACTTWEPGENHERANEEHVYYLFVAKKESDDE